METAEGRKSAPSPSQEELQEKLRSSSNGTAGISHIKLWKTDERLSVLTIIL